MLSVPAAGVSRAAPPRFEPGPCPYAAGRIPAGERVDCGVLLVLEDRDAPASTTLLLAVAIVRATSPAPAPDPVVYLEGGPGYGGLDSLEHWLHDATPIRARRDIILLDQRGT